MTTWATRAGCAETELTGACLSMRMAISALKYGRIALAVATLERAIARAEELRLEIARAEELKRSVDALMRMEDVR